MSTAETSFQNPAGRMEAHSSRETLSAACCSLRPLGRGQHTIGVPLQEVEAGRLADDDSESFRLHVEFVHAHGIPTGELTTLASGCVRATAMHG